MNARSIRRLIACAAVSSLAAAAASAQAPTALKVKLGLWEVTSSTQTSGTPPIDTSKMTPEQRARMEAMMKSMMQRMSAPRTVKSCLTQEKLDKAAFEDRNDCKTTTITNTTTDYAFKVVCAGEHPTSGDFHFHALSPESIQGTGELTVGNQMKVASTITGKWVGSACGDVK